jgi:hypothetical protein
MALTTSRAPASLRHIIEMFTLTPKYRVEARIEAHNALNTVIWDNPDVNVSNANFGKVTRKRVDGTGREVQVGLRFVF